MASAGPTFNSQQTILDLQDAIEFVNRRVINRADVVEQIFCALLTGEHALIQSRTGVGKSLLTEQVFMMFRGARYFKVQASKEQQPDTYFGGTPAAITTTTLALTRGHANQLAASLTARF